MTKVAREWTMKFGLFLRKIRRYANGYPVFMRKKGVVFSMGQRYLRTKNGS